MQLAPSCTHLTFEEDSYGNEKGSQKEIQQQFKRQILALGFISQQQIAQRQLQPFHTEQQRKKEHTRFGSKKVQLPKIQFQKIFQPEIFAQCRQGCSARNARDEKGQVEIGPQWQEGYESQAGHRHRPF
jgi:hypothetical protein